MRSRPRAISKPVSFQLQPPRMQYKDVSLASPQENLDLDESLLLMAEKQEGGEVLRFWESPVAFVVLGLSGKADVDVNEVNASKDHVPVLRRSSGGGTVVQGPGCLNYSLVLSKQKHPEL